MTTKDFVRCIEGFRKAYDRKCAIRLVKQNIIISLHEAPNVEFCPITAVYFWAKQKVIDRGSFDFGEIVRHDLMLEYWQVNAIVYACLGMDTWGIQYDRKLREDILTALSLEGHLHGPKSRKRKTCRGLTNEN